MFSFSIFELILWNKCSQSNTGVQAGFELKNHALSSPMETRWRLSTNGMKFVESSPQKKQNQTKSGLKPGWCQMEFKP